MRRNQQKEQEQNNRDTMRISRGLAVTTGIFNAVGLYLAIGSFIVTDHITKHDPLHWPALKALSLPVIVTFLTPVLLRQRRCRIWKWRYWRARASRLRRLRFRVWRIILWKPRYSTLRYWKLRVWKFREPAVCRANMFRVLLIMLAAGAIIELFILPRGARAPGTVIILAYGCLSMLTLGVRQGRERFDYINNFGFSFEGRIERLKATASAWQQISVYGMAAYMGFVAVALTIFWAATQNISEGNVRRSLGWYFALHLVIYTACVVAGPLHESFEMMFRSVRQLSNIQLGPIKPVRVRERPPSNRQSHQLILPIKEFRTGSD